MDNKINETPSAPQTELEHTFWGRRRRFPDEVEAEFQIEMERMRERRMRKTGLAAVLLYSAFAISDRVMIPDAYAKAWAIRFLVVVPLLLFCTFFVYRIRHAAWREAILSATLIVAGVSLPWIAGLSTHPNAAHYQTGVTLIVLFGNIVVSLRFRSALVTSVAMTVIYGLALGTIHSIPPEVRFNNWLFCFAAVAISLIANFRMDQDQRRAWFARLREHERNQELSHAVELLARLSAEDALTQIANRREFDRRLDIEWGRARRDGTPLALIMVDVDCFKNYNDHYGHQAGDACLQQIARSMRGIPQRPADLVARFGGEEFVALLPATSEVDAALLAERMRVAIVDLQIPHATSRVSSGVTASFGVAAMHPTGNQQPAALIAAADAALYAAKEKGRNGVALHKEGTELTLAAGVVH
ncbi:diguanylate cyclase domain-containing protein [Noviherbaspirillum sp. ST9]|uniref:GGDEF domain-containing protein n=1 Tax=Noviherbaspirillum sp. ST9 TaxID=3401606 RepID=UPI003B58972B